MSLQIEECWIERIIIGKEHNCYVQEYEYEY